MLIRNFGRKPGFGQQNFGQKNFVKKNLGQKNLDEKIFWSKNISVQIFFGPSNLRFKNRFVLKMFGSIKLGAKKFWPKIILDLKKFGSKLILGLKKIGSKKIFGQEKFGQNWFSNIWDFADMDKCRQVKWCLNKFHHDTWHLLKMVPESWLWSLVKIGSVTA